MPKRTSELTGSQIAQIRANLGRKASQLGDRLSKFAMGECDKNGKPIGMSQTQVTAAKTVLSHVLPGQVQQEVTAMNPDHGNPAEVRQQFEKMIILRLMDGGLTEDQAKDALRGKIAAQTAAEPAQPRPDQAAQPLMAKAIHESHVRQQLHS